MHDHEEPVEQQADFDPGSITRPDPALWTYYVIVSLPALVAAPIALLFYHFRYITLKYRLDDKGISMSWGILFRKEIYLTYRRIQDIHVTRNFIQRWLNLATVSVQTASGSAGAEMKIEGIVHPEALRNFLYQQMRGAKGEGEEADADSIAGDAAGPDEALQLLHEIRDELRALRRQREEAS